MMREKMLKGLIDHLMSIPDKTEHMSDHKDMMGNTDTLDSGVVGDEMHEMGKTPMMDGMKEHDEMPEGEAHVTVMKIQKPKHGKAF